MKESGKRDEIPLHNAADFIRDLIRIKANASHLPNVLLFANKSCQYGHMYYDLMAHTLREKESTMLRMLAGTVMEIERYSSSSSDVRELLC